MRLMPCIPTPRAPGRSGYAKRILTLGFVGALGLLTPLVSPSRPVQASEQAAIPLSQALDQLESALTSLEGSLPTQTSMPSTATASATPGVNSPASPKSILDRARQLYERRLYAATSSLLTEQFAHDPALAENPEALQLLGESLAEQGDLRGAKRSLSKLVESKPGDAQALLRLLALSTQLGADPQEKTWLSQLAAIPAANQPESAPYVRGKLLFLRGDAQAALPLLNTVAESSSFYHRARYLIGAAQIQLGKLDSAETVFKSLVDKPLPRRDDDLRVVESVCYKPSLLTWYGSRLTLRFAWPYLGLP